MPIINKKSSIYVILGTDPNTSQVIDYYVGSSQQVQRRFTEHKSELKAGKHKNKRLQAFWDNIVQNLPASSSTTGTGLNKKTMDSLFPHIDFFYQYKSTAWLVFIPVVEFSNDSSRSSKEIKAELEECEKAVADSLEQIFGFKGTNFWLYTGTPDRDSRTVCIDGQIYTNRSVAAKALGWMKNGKPDKQKVWACIARKAYPNFCFVDGELLTKKVEIRNSKGKLLGYEVFECGTAQKQTDGSYNISYYATPKLIEYRATTNSVSDVKDISGNN